MGMDSLSEQQSQHDAGPTRKSRILWSAARSFAASGFKGSSLRDIAADAEVSLTLLNHYFGSKANLLLAVVERHHKICRERMVDLSALVVGEDGPIRLDRLVAAWVRYEYDMYKSKSGKSYFSLMLKLLNDEEVDLSTRQMLDCSEAVMLRGFERSAPGTSKRCRLKAFLSARSVLHVGILDCAIAVQEGVPNAAEESIAFTCGFITAGLYFSLGVTQPADPACCSRMSATTR